MKKVNEVFIKDSHNIGWVDSDFTKEYGDEILKDQSQVLTFHKLTKSMNDSEIIKEFSIQECTLADVLATMNQATDDMKDGYANIFYIKGHPSHVVSVRWSDDEWCVFTWRRGGRTWSAGGRVFSPATEAKRIGALDSETLTLGPNKYVELVEWLYLNAGQLPNDTKIKLLAKLKEVIN